MKKNLSHRFALFACFVITAFIPAALHAQSKLSITMVGNAAIRMVIDDRHYICQDNSLTVEDLSPGYHSIKLFLVKKDRWSNSNHGQLVYNANLLLKPQFYTDIVVNRFGKTLVDEQPFSKGDFYDNYNWDDDRNKDPRYNDPRYPNIDPRGGNGGNGGNNGNGGGGGRGGYDIQPMPMTDDAFAQAREAVRKESFDNSKLVVAQQIADRNYFTSAQVREIARLFSFDDRKLDFVKNAYARTLDRNNYFIVNDVFAFSKSKEDLANYIKNFR
jgi:hypothetical protein